MSDVSFVRTEMLPEQAPPASSVGIIGWLRANLFSNITNSVLTLLSLFFVWYILSGLIPWTFQSVWTANSLTECREIMQERWGSTHGHACWAVINERWLQLLYGFYPPYPATPDVIVGESTGFLPAYFRPNLAMVLLLVAIAPVLFAEYVPRKLLIVTASYPFLMPWLMWGGSIWGPIMVAAGLGIGYLAYRFLTPIVGGIGGVVAAILLPVIWWLFLSGAVAGAIDSVIPIGIAEVESRKFGGFMLSVLIGVVAIGVSLPIGIVLALGRQSDLLIVKGLCVGFIEFIRGVPLITLLFVASTLLNIFMPPGTNFDIILRVMIMVTLFSAAYMAEVIRGGLAALPKGQYEGADSLGLDYWQSQRLIIMPQALKISIPGIVSNFIGVFKDTTLVSIIGLLDPIGLSQGIRSNAAWNGIYWELFAFIALIFFIVCFGMSRYSMYLERKLKTDHH
ncbi:MAG: amino acid ABC transporter permease [Paracoccaceae bacterium]